jgi:ATP-dependent RNA helicase RhlE
LSTLESPNTPGLLKKRNILNFNQFNLDPRLQAGIDHLGYTEATPIQTATLPVALAGKDLIATAQTGTGKTAAFVLPILQKLLSGPRNRTRALIVTPTRELAAQIHESIQDLGMGTNIRSTTVFGGVNPTPQVRALRDGVEILVACPGRLLDHLNQGNAKLQGVEILVLDEADRMFDMGFLPDVKRILKYIPAKRQTMLFSATFPGEIETLAAQTLTHPQRIAAGYSRPAVTVSHALYPVPQHLKTSLLLTLLKRTDTNSVLVFTRTKHRAEKLSRQIGQAGFHATSLHSDRSQSQRQSALAGFKSGHYQVMVATDIAARGLDVEGISHVINYDMPATADDYIHRIGRTGRAERTGDAFTLVTPDDKDMVRTLEKVMGKPLPHQMVEGFNYTDPAPERPASTLREPRHIAAASSPKQNSTNRQATRSFSSRTLRQKYAGGRSK